MAENKRFKKMSKKSKYAAYMYLAIAVCVVAVMTVSIYSLSFTDDPSELGISIPEIPTPSLPDQTGTGDTSDNSSAAQVDGTESNVDDTIIEKPTFVVPLEGTVTKKYSMNALVYSSTMKDYRTHSGVDIAASVGTNVLAISAGTVQGVYDDDLMGTCVVVDHGDGLTSTYCNLSAKPTVSEGDTVSTGTVLGVVGETAIAESAMEPPLHLEITKEGAALDPVSLLPDQL